MTPTINNSFVNASNDTHGSHGDPLFNYFSVTVAVIYLTLLLVFNSLLILAIVLEKSITGTLRLVLVNIVTAGQVVIVGSIFAAIFNIVISVEYRPLDFACRLAVWLVACGGAARLMYMTTFAISVYISVRYGARKMKIWVAVVAVIGVWLAVLLTNATIFSSDIIKITFHDYHSCGVHGTGYKTTIYVFGYISVYGLLGFAVSVLFAIATVWFIRHRTIPGNITLVKALVKFAVFLILGNIINFAGQATPLLFATFAPDEEDWHILDEASHYAEATLILLSLVPTPLLILIYFRPVRKRIKRIICGVCVRKSEKNESGKTPATSTMNALSADAGKYM